MTITEMALPITALSAHAGTAAALATEVAYGPPHGGIAPTIKVGELTIDTAASRDWGVQLTTNAGTTVRLTPAESTPENILAALRGLLD